jgi:hypothetical protein
LPLAKAKVKLEPVRDAERTQAAILAAAEEEFVRQEGRACEDSLRSPD